MAKPVCLQKLGLNEFKKFIASFDHVFSDCDDVIWAKTPLPGSGKFFELIKQQKKTIHFVSNNSVRTKEEYEALFKASGINNGFERLTLPSTAVAEYLKSINFNKKVYCVTCPETRRILESNGFTCEEGPDVCLDYYGDYVCYLKDDPEIGAVVFDSDFKINLPKIYKAITYLRRPDVLFINGASDKYVRIEPGYLTLGTGVFTDMAAEETKRHPIQLGKPGKLFGELAMLRAGVTDPSTVLFIGDMIEQDVGLGKATGFKTLLVLTSSSEEDMLAHKTIQPDFYAESLGSLTAQLEELN